MMETILNRNNQGVSIVRHDYKQRSAVKVKGPVNNTIMTYRMNNIPDYKHPLLSWSNLDLCGGWAYDEADIIKNINAGKKLCGTICIDTEHDSQEELEEAVKALKIKDTHGCALIYKWQLPYSGQWHWVFLVAPEGKLADHFNLDEIRAAYEAQNVPFSDDEWSLVERLANDRMVGLPYNPIHPEAEAELVITGLLFGYPIESTASLLWGF